MPQYSVQYSPAGQKPKNLLYVNRDGFFTIDEDEGRASYVWPPGFDADGNPQINNSLDGFDEGIRLEKYTEIKAPPTNVEGAVTDEGWIFKVNNENFWLFFGNKLFVPGEAIYRMYYSYDGTSFSRWYTEDGTRRTGLTKPPVNNPTTPGGGISTGSVPDAVEIGLGRHKFPNDIRVCPEPNPFKNHGFDTRDHFVRVWMEVSAPNIESIKEDLRDCAVKSAGVALVAAAVTAIEGGGAAAFAAAKATFITTFKACVQAKLGNIAQQLNPQVDYKNEFGDWSGH